MRFLLLLLISLPSFGAWGYARTVTVDQTKVSGSTDFTDFPVLVSGTYSYLATVANGGKVTDAQGDDVIFTSDSACVTKLDHEVERYIATTGEVVYWVRIPTLLAASDHVFYLCYENAAVTTTQEAITGVWSSAYKGVWHLPNGTSLTALDSTSGAFNGTVTNATAQTGKLDGAAGFAGEAGAAKIEAGTSLTLQPATALTVSAWIKGNSWANTYNAVVAATGSGANDHQSFFVKNADSKLAVYLGSVATYESTGVATLSTATWYHIVVTYDKVNLKAYVNGVLDATVAATDDLLNSTSNTFRIGDGDTVSTRFDGSIDEVRVLNVARTADWVTTEYSNQFDPSTFYALGSETALGATPAMRRRQVVF